MFYQLPPVGNPVILDKSKKLDDVPEFSSYKTYFYESGTAALSSALVATRDMAESALQDSCHHNTGTVDKQEKAEVIFPAYGCPDLISAAVYADVKPVLVDLEADSPWMNLSLLQGAITEKTIAIVRVDLLGISERWTELRAVAKQHDIVLIEDSAQYFPGRASKAEKDGEWRGDLIVLSFGRGKPVSLLGGGAVLVNRKHTNSDILYDCLPKPRIRPIGLIGRIIYRIKVKIYNIMISPFCYWLPQVLPFLHLGETRYHPLLGIDAIDQLRLDMLASNISRYQNDDMAIARCEKISSAIELLNNVVNLPLIKDIEVKKRLLRYPILVEDVTRGGVYEALRQAGLGVSSMYPSSLPNISGLESVLGTKEFNNAEAFAARIITLPTHSYVSNKIIAKMKAVFEKLN